MRTLTDNELEKVSGGQAWELSLAEAYVGVVAGGAMTAVGVPLLAAGAIGFALAGSFVLIGHLVDSD